jgi:hypothetical protein
MTQIDKINIPISKAFVVFGFLAQAIITYTASQYGAQAAIKQLQYETQLQLNDLKYEDKLLWNRVNMIASNTYRHEAVKPEEVKPKEEE